MTEYAEPNNDLFCPSELFSFSNGWARLRIDISMMSPEQRKALSDAENLLSIAGVGFDTGTGGGFRDWELDWSLHGAHVETRPMTCMMNIGHAINDLFWGVYRFPSGNVLSYPYCSVECRDVHRIRLNDAGGECLYVC